MTEIRDPQIGALLDRLVPATEERPDWSRILADARLATPSTDHATNWFRGRKRALALVLVAVVLLVIAPLTALAVSQGWWFFKSVQAPKPISAVRVITTGTWRGIPWTLSAYRSATNGVCFAFTPRSTSNPSGSAAIDCDTITGVPVTPQSKHSAPHAISYLTGGGGSFPGYITGPVIASARSVEIIFATGKPLRVPTIAAPGSLHSRIRFYLAKLPLGHPPVKALIGRGARNGIVAFRPTRVAAAIPVAAFQRISNQGKPVRLTLAMKHLIQHWHHNTTVKLWLLASRNGRTYFRITGLLTPLGHKHIRGGVPKVCYALGRKGARFPIGDMACTPKTATSFPSLQQPAWDFSIYGANRGQKTLTLFRLAGFASDAVKAVKLLDGHGRVIERVPVIDNVYTLKRPPKGVVAVVPADINGKPLAECGPNKKVTANGSYLNAHC